MGSAREHGGAGVEQSDGGDDAENEGHRAADWSRALTTAEAEALSAAQRKFRIF